MTELTDRPHLIQLVGDDNIKVASINQTRVKSGVCIQNAPSLERAPDRAVFASDLAIMVTRFSLFWLVAANFVGMWMAVLLVKPKLGSMLGEYSYGRWVPLHLDWQLYGWCSLPLVGALFSFFLEPGKTALSRACWVLNTWSAALLLGGLSWLNGETTGKLFLDWSGTARLALIGAQIFLWCVLATSWWNPPNPGRTRSLLSPLLLLALAGIPLALLWAGGRDVYPAIDPGTGGPTGASLLGSTLGIILIFSLVPGLLGLRGPDATAKRLHWISFSVSCAVFALLDRHQSSHHDWRQIAGLASLLVWIPLLANYLRGVHWNESSRPWLISALCWWTLLVVTGFVEFCPGILDRAKFTHALVAHAHLAMAGLLTSFNMLLLNNLGVTSGSLAKRTPFALWHFGLFVHLTSLAALAAFETSTAGWVLQHSSMQVTLYVVRLCAGAIMTAASIWWLADVARDRAMVRA